MYLQTTCESPQDEELQDETDREKARQNNKKRQEEALPSGVKLAGEDWIRTAKAVADQDTENPDMEVDGDDECEDTPEVTLLEQYLSEKRTPRNLNSRRRS